MEMKQIEIFWVALFHQILILSLNIPVIKKNVSVMFSMTDTLFILHFKL